MRLIRLFILKEADRYGSGGPRRSDAHGIDDPSTERYAARTEPFHPDEQRMVDRIVKVARQHGATLVVLFGSRARDDWRPDSDFDVYVEGVKDVDALADQLFNVDVLDDPSVMQGWPQIVLYKKDS